ncbi:MAG: Fur family transcriptional regulator [Planctomycetaceae bacterium]
MTDLTSIHVAVSPAAKFREYLSTRSQRLTREKSIIVDEIFSSHEHFDAEQLIERLTSRTDGSRVSRSTVYRTLSDLEKAGLIRKVAQTDGRHIFEHDYGYPQHDHLICNKCKTLIEFENDDISRILEVVAGQHGFLMEGHRMEVHGTCEDCRRSTRRRHRKLDQI